MAQPCMLVRSTLSLHTPIFRSTRSPRGIVSLNRRTFIGPANPLTLHASRTLPYSVESLYGLISDIEEYPHFIPYCKSAKVLTQSHPDSLTNNKWPATATLSIGYGNLSGSFLSKVYCVPNEFVEAISGDTITSLSPNDIGHYDNLPDHDSTETQNDLFSSLRTRWSLRGYPFKPAHRHPQIRSGEKQPQEVSLETGGTPEQGEPGIKAEQRTDVNLIIEVAWKNPVYAAASQALAPSVAGKIVDAFERRAKEILGKGGSEPSVQGGQSISGRSEIETGEKSTIFKGAGIPKSG